MGAGGLRAPEAPLENYANNSSSPGQSAARIDDGARARRTARYARRAALWRLSELPRCRTCGKVRTAGFVGVRVRDGVAGFSGLATCGSIWVCPICNSKVMARRALELGGAVGIAQSMGLHVGLVTLTLRHHSGQRLAELWDALGKGWGSVTSGAHWARDSEVAGLVGFLRVVEVTIGENGWHPHAHALLFLEDPTRFRQLTAGMWQRWRRSIERQGLGVPMLRGQDFHLVTGPADVELGQYLTKVVDQGVGRINLELTATQNKGPRGDLGTKPWWSLLTSIIEDGDADALLLWHEWEQASKGRRQISWSQALRPYLGMGKVVDDATIAAESVGTEDDTVVLITATGWSSLVARPTLIPRVLDVAESQGFKGLSHFLDAEGVEFIGGL